MMAVEQRVSHVEGRLDSLATKADLAELKAGLAELKADLTWRIFWAQLLGMAAMAAVVTAAVAVMRFLE